MASRLLPVQRPAFVKILKMAIPAKKEIDLDEEEKKIQPLDDADIDILKSYVRSVYEVWNSMSITSVFANAVRMTLLWPWGWR